MIYKDFQDLKLSALGMGCMRLPVVGGNDAVVDEAAAMIAAAVNEALRGVADLSSQRINAATGGMNIPGLM